MSDALVPTTTTALAVVDIDAALTAEEQPELERLTEIEDWKDDAQVTLGPVVSVGLLRRRYLEGAPGGTVVDDLPCFGVICMINGHAVWMAHGLEALPDHDLTSMWRKSEEVSRAIVREQVRRELQGAT